MEESLVFGFQRLGGCKGKLQGVGCEYKSAMYIQKWI